MRDGVFGRLSPETTVARCGGCGVDRLDEKDCVNDAFYQTDAYRNRLRQELDSDSYFATHDALQIYTLQQLRASSLRGATIVDERWVRFTGGFGQLKIGHDDNAAYSMVYQAPVAA
ncbi:MAG: hypothetical protein IIA17_02430, partial [candidate division Zixibacteria bacterium]|nr:hypothetical protein [candidate division Zixibacteria bacterium]